MRTVVRRDFAKSMEKLHFNIFINAPKEKVWDAMLNDATYREWTKAFNKDSHYEGKWEKGSKMLFLGCDENGGIGGMVSEIEEVRPYEFISILHRGLVQNGVEDTTSDMVKGWAGAHENYTFTERDGGTEVSVDIDIVSEMKDEFEGSWPKSLEALKEIAER